MGRLKGWTIDSSSRRRENSSDSGFNGRRELIRSLFLSGTFAALGDWSWAKPSRRARKGEPASASGYEGAGSLRSHAGAAGLEVGCAVRPSLLDVALGLNSSGPTLSKNPYTRTVLEQSNILVAENAMKWSSLRPGPDQFRFDESDRFVHFATEFGEAIRGHTLCWHEQLPAWFGGTANRGNARELLARHIQTVVSRYAGRMHSWDVVNEAVQVSDGRPDGLRESPWLELIGPEYIELAFVTAAASDAQAKLTYNEFDIELDTPEQAQKRAEVLLLLRRLRARNVPVHALGIQSHLKAYGPRPGRGVLDLIRSAADLGLEVYITELDVNCSGLPGSPELQRAAVAAVMRDYLELVLQEPNVRAVLTWGISDAHSWLNESMKPWAIRPDGAVQHPLPFDERYEPNPAFFAIRDALDHSRQTVVPAR